MAIAIHRDTLDIGEQGSRCGTAIPATRLARTRRFASAGEALDDAIRPDARDFEEVGLGHVQVAVGIAGDAGWEECCLEGRAKVAFEVSDTGDGRDVTGREVLETWRDVQVATVNRGAAGRRDGDHDIAVVVGRHLQREGRVRAGDGGHVLSVDQHRGVGESRATDGDECSAGDWPLAGREQINPRGRPDRQHPRQLHPAVTAAPSARVTIRRTMMGGGIVPRPPGARAARVSPE